MLSEQQVAELSKKLDPKHVKPAKTFGPKGDYIEGWHVIAEANKIFGFDGWSYSIKTLTQDALEVGENSKGEDQWRASYTCIVTLAIMGAVREDVGFGSGFAKNKGDAIEGATKEAVTDALKRALRTWGNRFGLALYDKTRENVGVEKREATDAEKRDWLKGAMTKARTKQQLADWFTRPKIAATIAGLHEPMRLEIEAEFNRLHDKLIDDPAMQAPGMAAE